MMTEIVDDFHPARFAPNLLPAPDRFLPPPPPSLGSRTWANQFSEIKAIGQDTSMRFSIHVEPKHHWNYLAGVNWTIDKSWGVVTELGFGNSRSDVIVTGFFRF